MGTAKIKTDTGWEYIAQGPPGPEGPTGPQGPGGSTPIGGYLDTTRQGTVALPKTVSTPIVWNRAPFLAYGWELNATTQIATCVLAGRYDAVFLGVFSNDTSVNEYAMSCYLEQKRAGNVVRNFITRVNIAPRDAVSTNNETLDNNLMIDALVGDTVEVRIVPVKTDLVMQSGSLTILPVGGVKGDEGLEGPPGEPGAQGPAGPQGPAGVVSSVIATPVTFGGGNPFKVSAARAAVLQNFPNTINTQLTGYGAGWTNGVVAANSDFGFVELVTDGYIAQMAGWYSFDLSIQPNQAISNFQASIAVINASGLANLSANQGATTVGWGSINTHAQTYLAVGDKILFYGIQAGGSSVDAHCYISAARLPF